jgi:hypothetical protein
MTEEGKSIPRVKQKKTFLTARGIFMHTSAPNFLFGTLERCLGGVEERIMRSPERTGMRKVTSLDCFIFLLWVFTMWKIHHW